MGFNLGAALSGAAEGASDTYFKLKKQKREDEEMQQRRDVHEAFKREQAENEQLRALAGETYGRVDQPESFRTAGGAMGPQLESAQTALPANAAEAFPAQKMYGRDQAMRDFQSRAMGINPTKAMDYETKALQNQGARQNLKKGEYELTRLERDSRQDAAFETYMAETHKKLTGMRQEIQGTFDTDGMNGLVKKYGSDFKDATGNSVALVGNALVIKDSKGKVIGQPVTRPEDAVNALSNVIGQKAMQSSLDGMITKGLFRNPAEMMDYFTKRNTMETQTSNAQSQRMSAMASQTSANASAQNAATQASIAPSTIALHNAQAGYATQHGNLLGQSVKLAENNAAAREAMQPFLDQITQIKDPSTPEGKLAVEQLTIKAIAAGASKSSDIKTLLESVTKKPKEPISNKDIIDFVKEFGDAPSNEKDKKGMPIPIRQLPPSKQKAYAEDFFQKGTGTGEQGGLNSDVKPEARNPETPAAPAAAIPTKTQSAAVPATVPASAPMPVKTVAYGKTGYKMPGMLGVFATPEQAQAAWAQKNAPMAPAGRFD